MLISRPYHSLSPTIQSSPPFEMHPSIYLERTERYTNTVHFNLLTAFWFSDPVLWEDEEPNVTTISAAAAAKKNQRNKIASASVNSLPLSPLIHLFCEHTKRQQQQCRKTSKTFKIKMHFICKCAGLCVRVVLFKPNWIEMHNAHTHTRSTCSPSQQISNRATHKKRQSRKKRTKWWEVTEHTQTHTRHTEIGVKAFVFCLLKLADWLCKFPAGFQHQHYFSFSFTSFFLQCLL